VNMLGRVGPRRPPVRGACRSVRLKVAAQARSSAHPPDRRPRLQTDAAHPRTQCKVSTQPRFEFTFITCVLHLTTSWCVRTEYNKTKMIEDEYDLKIRFLDYLRSKNTGKYFLSILTISPEAFNLMKLGNFQEKEGL
jgi:hypothetical protein